MLIVLKKKKSSLGLKEALLGVLKCGFHLRDQWLEAAWNEPFTQA